MLEEILKIPSTTLPSECYTIFDIASRLLEQSVVVETGTGAGRVTAVLAAAIAGKGSILHTVDNYSQQGKYEKYGKWSPQNAQKNLSELGLDGHVRFLRGDSAKVGAKFKEQIDMIYLDGAHNYEDVCKEIIAWYPHIKQGGIVAGHDFDPGCNDGRHVIKAVFDKLLQNPDTHLQVVGRVWWMEKI